MTPIHTYKSKIASRYIPVDAEQIGMKIPESESYFASIKHDGHLAFLSIQEGKAELFDRNGDPLKIKSIVKHAVAIKENVILAGELCVFQNDQSTSHREVNAALDDSDKADFRFGAFDVLEVNGVECEWETEEKFQKLSEWLKGNKEIFAIEQNKFESRKEIITFFKAATEAKAEGVIVKTPNGVTYKIKQMHHLDLVVLGYAESVGEKEGELRELLLGMSTGKDTYQLVSKCGGGFSDKERSELIAQLSPLAVHSEYTEVSGAKTAFVFVQPEMVVEISCLDLINENSSGPIRKAHLSFSKENGYSLLGNAPTISVISPNFVRVRTDKKVNEKETGTTQAYALCEPLTASAAADTGAASVIVLREVFTKSGKGGTAVRKFVSLKTNKEKSGAYAPYVVVYSDFSAGRKTPLEQEIFLCENEKAAAAKLTELKEENIKKGWEQFK